MNDLNDPRDLDIKVITTIEGGTASTVEVEMEGRTLVKENMMVIEEEEVRETGICDKRLLRIN